MVNRKTISKLFLIVSIAIPLLFLFPILVHSATFTVDSVADAVDASPGDGVCADGSGNCTLRAAIIEANALGGTTTIVFAPSVVPGTFTLSIAGAYEDAAATGDLDLIGDLVIIGAGASETILDGGGLDRVFDVLFTSSAVISGVTVQNGYLLGTGGGILNNGTLTLTDLTISGNETEGSDGGGIENGGTLTIKNSVISGNVADFPGGGGGGGISNHGTLILKNSTVSGNITGDEGGGIQHDGPSMTMTNSTVSDNKAPDSAGGGIGSFSGTLTITNSTVSGNVTGDVGGGIWNAGSLTMISSTISQNSAANAGGGIEGSADVMNTIIANSLAGGDCSGEITSLDYNLDSDGTCNLTQPNDLPNTDPSLGPLADNGGSTLTHALLEGSPAIDVGDNENCPETDQRGVTRPQDGDGDGDAICDIGAYEFLPPYIEVNIDIKPGSYPNSINPRSKGKIPVAILSSMDFDAPTEVDTESLSFGPTGDEESLAFCNRSFEDVNDDGYDDIVCHFYTQMTGFECGDEEGILKGQTVDETSLEGSDSVRIVPSACR